ncbi:MAG: HD family phosphohydrolase [Clostridiales bacterium]|nr:HD family phosphohydrolase [Clostridiales bacterium]
MNILKEKNWIESYCGEVGDLLKNSKVQEMKNYPHHGKISTHFHSVYVSYIVYKASVKMGADARSIVRASLLHDLYLYDWHTTKHEEKHAWYHPKAAVKNIEKYKVSDLTPMQRDMILSHMWPLHKTPPNSVGGFLLTWADKYCADRELLYHAKGFIPVYNEILRRGEN